MILQFTWKEKSILEKKHSPHHWRGQKTLRSSSTRRLSLGHAQKRYKQRYFSSISKIRKGIIKMPEWGYSTTELDTTQTAKASGREIRVSHKCASEICRTIKGMNLQKAKAYLKRVIHKKTPVPFRRHKKKIPHRRGLQQRAYAGRYPVKAAQKILQVLESAEANAEYKGLDLETLKITHTSAYPGMKIKRYKPRAFGRWTPDFETLCHIEVVLEQTEVT